MRPLVLALALSACGGSSTPPKTPDPVVSPTPTTRKIIEDDSEPEEGVTIINSRGRMDPAVVEAGIAPFKEALSECYTTNLDRRRWLGGQVMLWWDINKEGTVTGVHLHETEPGTNLGNWEIEKCILDVARQATFGKPIGGDADFQIPLEFTARGHVVSWDDDQALRAVGGQTATIDECVHPKKPPPKRPAKKELKKERPVAPKGPITITMYVGPGGKAQSVGFAGTPAIDDNWAECAAKIAMSWRLPDPRGSVAKLEIKYPR